jgi:hypothetical protein
MSDVRIVSESEEAGTAVPAFRPTAFLILLVAAAAALLVMAPLLIGTLR